MTRVELDEVRKELSDVFFKMIENVAFDVDEREIVGILNITLQSGIQKKIAIIITSHADAVASAEQTTEVPKEERN